MSPEEEKEFENLFDLFSHPGWKILMRFTKEDAEALANIRVVTTPEDLWRNKGKVEVLDNMLTLQAYMEEAYAQAKED